MAHATPGSLAQTSAVHVVGEVLRLRNQRRWPSPLFNIFSIFFFFLFATPFIMNLFNELYHTCS